jgi:hypothetical protein
MYSYIAKIIDKIDNGPGIMNSIRVGVFRVESDREEQIGEYIRNYSSLFETFYYFGKDSTNEAKHMVRRLARDEALFAGTSTGANVLAAIQVAVRLGSGQTVATVACDSGLKYLSTDLYTLANMG